MSVRASEPAPPPSRAAVEGRYLNELTATSTKSAYYSTETAKYDKQRRSVAKARLGFLIAFIVALGLLISWQLAMTYIRYGEFISFIDKYKPKDVWHPSGLSTAFAIEIPGIAEWAGFTNPSIAEAAYLSYYGDGLSETFKKKPTEYLASIWNIGTNGSAIVKNPNPNAMTIICEGWACEAGLPECFPACPTFRIPWIDAAAGGALGGVNGVFLSGIVSPGGGIGLRAGMGIAFFAAYAGLAVWKSASATSAAKKNLPHCSKTSS